MKILSILFVLFINTILFSQAWHKEAFIDIPGDNYDFDIGCQYIYFGDTTYISWINKRDSIYNVYIKKISPNFGNNILVVSDSIIKSNSKITPIYNGKGFRIVWQNKIENHFQIIMRNFVNDTLRKEIVVQDSILNNPKVALSGNRIMWLVSGKLKLIDFTQGYNTTIVIDSQVCNTPVIQKQDDENWASILYEKMDSYGNHQLYKVEYSKYWNPHWSVEKISDGDNRNPSFNYGLINGGPSEGFSFEKIENKVSKVKYSIYSTFLHSTQNEKCNYKNPVVFYYGLPLSGTVDTLTPFFLAFDTDSLNDNNEIFIQIIDTSKKLINISSMAGNDSRPKITYLSRNDTNYVAILWLHKNNNKTDIWISKEILLPTMRTAVRDNNTKINSLELYQNYPNPFNPSTKIVYELNKTSNVVLKVYDSSGREVKELIHGYENSGTHEVIFNGKRLSSGIYYYQLEVGNSRITKKMVLLK